MEGRTIVRPELSVGSHTETQRAPSMEGRTIVRPEIPPICDVAAWSSTFNGGPDNCPAGAATPAPHAPGHAAFNGGPDNCPAGASANKPG